MLLFFLCPQIPLKPEGIFIIIVFWLFEFNHIFILGKRPSYEIHSLKIKFTLKEKIGCMLANP